MYINQQKFQRNSRKNSANFEIEPCRGTIYQNVFFLMDTYPLYFRKQFRPEIAERPTRAVSNYLSNKRKIFPVIIMKELCFEY